MKLHKNISQSVIQALKTIFSEGAYADDTVRNLLQSNPKWGSRDRRFIASSIYTVVRWWKRYAFIANTSIEDASCFEKDPRAAASGVRVVFIINSLLGMG